MPTDLKSWLVGAGGALVAAVTGLHPTVQALILLTAVDIATGWAKAAYTGTLSSDASMKGFTKKAVMLLMVSVAWIVEHKLGLDLPMDIDLTVAGFYCATEVFSIIENAKAMDVPVPDALMNRFEKKGEDAKK